MSNRICMGEHDSLGYGLYVSKPGKDAESDIGQDLIFSSTNGTGTGSNIAGNSALHDIMTLTLTAGQTSVSGTITGLAYVPMVTWAEFSGDTTLGVKFTNSKSAGGGSQPTGGAHPMAGGRSSSAFSHYYCKVTNTSVTIGTWISGTHYYSGEYYNYAYSLQFPYDISGYGSNGQLTATKYFKVFVYRLPATS